MRPSGWGARGAPSTSSRTLCAARVDKGGMGRRGDPRRVRVSGVHLRERGGRLAAAVLTRRVEGLGVEIVAVQRGGRASRARRGGRSLSRRTDPTRCRWLGRRRPGRAPPPPSGARRPGHRLSATESVGPRSGAGRSRPAWATRGRPRWSRKGRSPGPAAARLRGARPRAWRRDAGRRLATRSVRTGTGSAPRMCSWRRGGGDDS